MKHPKSSSRSTESSKCISNSSSQNYQNNNRNNADSLDINTVNNNIVQMETDDDNWAAELVATSNTSPEERRATKYLNAAESSKSNYVYSSFLYWRDPVPDLELVDVDLGTENIEHCEQIPVETELDQVRADFSKLDVESSTEEEVSETEREQTETSTEEKTEEMIQHTPEDAITVDHAGPEESKENNIEITNFKEKNETPSSNVSETTTETGELAAYPPKLILKQ